MTSAQELLPRASNVTFIDITTATGRTIRDRCARQGGLIETRQAFVHEKLMGPVVFMNAAPFLRIPASHFLNRCAAGLGAHARYDAPADLCGVIVRSSASPVEQRRPVVAQRAAGYPGRHAHSQ